MERTKGNTPLLGQASYLSPAHLVGAAAVVACPLMEAMTEDLTEELTGVVMEALTEAASMAGPTEELMEELLGVLMELLTGAWIATAPH